MYFDNSSNARRKRKLAAWIKRSLEKERAGYRATAREAQEAKRKAEQNAALREFSARNKSALQAPEPQALPVLPELNFTPEEIAAILEAAKELREQHRKGASA